MQIDRLRYFLSERVSIQRKKDAGEPWPWTTDEILRDGIFCHIERERDRTTRWIIENWREPHADDPHLIVALAIARLINRPATLAEIGFPLPWSDEIGDRLIARYKRGEPCFYQQAYKTVAVAQAYGGGGMAHSFAKVVFPALWAARDSLRPQPGDTCQAVCDRLTALPGWGLFLAGQVIADLKYVEPLKSAPDWTTFGVSGDGSRRGLNRILGRPVNAAWREDAWYREACKLRELIAPDLDALGLGGLHMQDLNNLACEYDKFERWSAEGVPPAKHYQPPGSKPVLRKTRPGRAPGPAPAPIAPPPSDWQLPTELPVL
jgi:hypothetical protein